MSNPGTPLLSVRGHARQLVPPDYAVLAAALESCRGSKAKAAQAVALDLGRLTAALAALGGI
ncbi:MAG: SIMPL domain-containing protein, partial [Actinomycetota bacterium]